MHKYRVEGLNVREVGPSSLLSEDPIYVTVGKPKDGDGDPRIACRGTYDECADYVERNESPDNYERYAVAEVLLSPYARPGYTSAGSATLQLVDRLTHQDVGGEYQLRYLPDTNEVVLLKGDEVVYSELLS